MIYVESVERYCSNYELIENYQEAVSSPEKWVCHHRKETDEDLSVQELKQMGLYYGRPPEEMIFLTKKQHNILHNTGRMLSKTTKNKISNAHKGKQHSIETRKKMSNSRKGDKNHRYKHICPALLQMMYVEQKKSAYKMAQELRISRNVILRHLRELNIPIRKR